MVEIKNKILGGEVSQEAECSVTSRAVLVEMHRVPAVLLDKNPPDAAEFSSMQEKRHEV